MQIVPEMEENGVLSKSVTCEDRTAFLQDSIQPYVAPTYYAGDATRNGLQQFIDLLLSNHNAMVEDYKKIYRGNVSVISYSSTEAVYKGLNYETTWDAIKSKLLDSFGGEIRIRETDGTLYLDYSDQLGALSPTHIKLARNMLSASYTPDFKGVVSRLIPLGVKIADSEERLTIASVNDGKTYLDDETAKQKYGIVSATQTWDDVTVAGNLKQKALSWLEDNNNVPVSVGVRAVDLSLLGLEPEGFKLHNRYPVENSLLGISTVTEIVKITYDFDKPYETTFDMGEIRASQIQGTVSNYYDYTAGSAQISEIASATSALSADYAEFKQSAGQQLEDTIDYIVQRGKLNGWSYEVYRSGTAKCWIAADFGNVNISTANGAGFIGNTMLGAQFPFAFEEPPAITLSPLSTSFSVFSPTSAVTASGIPQITVFRFTSASEINVKIAIMAVGIKA